MELLNISLPIVKELARVEKEIKELVQNFTSGSVITNGFIVQKTKTEVQRIIEHFFKIPGKRLRPILVLLSAKSVNPDLSVRSRSPVTMATIVELIHAASLIHDDVIDEAVTRRGQSSLNGKFGNRLAVLAGDILYAQSFSLLANLADEGEKHSVKNSELRTAIIQIICHMTELMCKGEILEAQGTGLNLPHQNANDLDKYLEIIGNKTASFMSACCQCGALLAGADERVAQSLASYGFNVGLLYQIRDDLQDKEYSSVVELARKQVPKFAMIAKQHLEVLPDSVYKDKLIRFVDYIVVQKSEPKPVVKQFNS